VSLLVADAYALLLQVVQVYTYMLSPLMVQPGVEAGHARVARKQQQQQQQGHASGVEGQGGGVFGWQLRLVMEYCDQVGSKQQHSAPLLYLHASNITNDSCL
jgi:hypothetical protein